MSKSTNEVEIERIIPVVRLATVATLIIDTACIKITLAILLGYPQMFKTIIRR